MSFKTFSTQPSSKIMQSQVLPWIFMSTLTFDPHLVEGTFLIAVPCIHNLILGCCVGLKLFDLWMIEDWQVCSFQLIDSNCVWEYTTYMCESYIRNLTKEHRSQPPLKGYSLLIPTCACCHQTKCIGWDCCAKLKISAFFSRRARCAQFATQEALSDKSR